MVGESCGLDKVCGFKMFCGRRADPVSTFIAAAAAAAARTSSIFDVSCRGYVQLVRVVSFDRIVAR